MSFRKVIFWMHLLAGVIAGAVIFVMSATGVALAFENEIVAWAERDLRRVTPPNDSKPLSVDEMLANVRRAQPAARSAGITIHADPHLAATVSLGRTNTFYVNPYTGDVKAQTATKTRAFMQLMIDWHRYLGAQGNSRPRGKAITGACNAAFCLLGISGLYLWWPRRWTKRAFRSVALFERGLRGKARDWNWHNVIGLWSAPVLIVVTATAMPISYRWATELIYKLTRSEAPPPSGPGAAVKIPTPPADAKPLAYAELLASVQRHAPHWQQITLRPGGGGGRGGERTAERASNAPRAENRGEPQAVNFTVKQRDGSPRFATAQFSLNPFTGEVLRAERYADYNLGRRVRSWTRFLHTGEALGPVGQLVAGLASLGGIVLFYTGLALAVRRFLRWRRPISNVAMPVLESTIKQ